MRLYVNGAFNTSRGTGEQSLDTSGPIMIGRGYLEETQSLDGSLDQVRIYERALNESEISTLFSEQDSEQN